MKKLFLGLLVLFISLTSCEKDELCNNITIRWDENTINGFTTLPFERITSNNTSGYVSENTYQICLFRNQWVRLINGDNTVKYYITKYYGIETTELCEPHDTILIKINQN